MFFENRYRDNEPLTRIGTFPVYCITIIVAILAAGLIASAIFGYMSAAMMFAFNPEVAWRHGQVWRAITYLGVGDLNFFSLFSLLFLYSFGRDCEQELGRQRFLGFLSLLIVAPLAVSTLLWLFGGTGGMIAGSQSLSMGLVIAFATIYPNVQSFGTIPMKFVALGCMFLSAIGYLREGNQTGLIAMLGTCALSFGYIRAMRAGAFEGFSINKLFERKPKFRVVPKPEPAARRRVEMAEPDDVDALLDKIARTGIASLTPKERARLEQAREALMRKDQR